MTGGLTAMTAWLMPASGDRRGIGTEHLRGFSHNCPGDGDCINDRPKARPPLTERTGNFRDDVLYNRHLRRVLRQAATIGLVKPRRRQMTGCVRDVLSICWYERPRCADGKHR